MLTIFNHIVVWVCLLLFIYAGAGTFIGADLNVKLTSSQITTGQSSSQYKYKGVTFKTKEDAIEVIKRESVGVYFPWIFILPLNLSIFILAFCSGSFGGVIKIFKEIALNNKEIAKIPVLYLMFFAGFIGLMVLGVSFLLPTALTASKSTPWPIAIMFLSIFGGLFCENTTTWLEKIYKKLFK